MNILVVDDLPLYRLLLKSLLTDMGLDVFTAEDGEDAIETMARVEIDLIISDIYMPIMDGVKLHQAVRSNPRYEEIPFIFVSAYNDDHALEFVKDPRRETFLQKTAAIEKFVEWISYFSIPESVRDKTIPVGEPSFGISRKEYSATI
jgi:CheY-like chemotaxis protein